MTKQVVQVAVSHSKVVSEASSSDIGKKKKDV